MAFSVISLRVVTKTTKEGCPIGGDRTGGNKCVLHVVSVKTENLCSKIPDTFYKLFLENTYTLLRINTLIQKILNIVWHLKHPKLY